MPRDAASKLPIAKYALREAGRLLKRLGARMSRAAKRRDPDSIHDLRVAIRRLGACLRVFRSLLAASGKIRRGLKEMMDLASEVRNCDIALDLSNQAGLAPDSPVRGRLAAERSKAERKLLALMERRRRRETFDRWRDRLSSPKRERKRPARSDWSRRQSACANARRHLPLLVRVYFEEGRRAARRGASEAELHRFRLATKTLRYTLELFRGCYGPGLARYLRSLRRIQNSLGAMNDCVTTRKLVTPRLPVNSAARRAMETFLARRAQQHLARFTGYWTRSFDKPGQRTRWLRFLRR